MTLKNYSYFEVVFCERLETGDRLTMRITTTTDSSHYKVEIGDRLTVHGTTTSDSIHYTIEIGDRLTVHVTTTTDHRHYKITCYLPPYGEHCEHPPHPREIIANQKSHENAPIAV